MDQLDSTRLNLVTLLSGRQQTTKVLAVSTNSSTTSSTEIDSFGLVEWVKEQPNAFVHPNIEIRLVSSNLAIFAKERIEEGETIIQIPWNIIILGDQHQQADNDGYLDCTVVRKLAKELKLGENSKYAPYIRHLLALRDGQIPSAWSDAGKALLVAILGGDEQQLPPASIVDMIDDEWFGSACHGDKTDALATKAAELVLQRGDMDLMVPLFDLIQHRNGDYTNTKTQVVDKECHRTIASRPIEAGEQIYKTHDLCDECNNEAIEHGYGTAEIFRDYGIIEDFPQRWSLQPGAVELQSEQGDVYVYSLENIRFSLLPDKDGTIQVKWHESIQFDEPGRNYIRRIFRKEIQRLYRFKNVVFDMSNPNGIPQHEWDGTWNYYDAIKTAFVYAIHSLDNKNSNQTSTFCENGQSYLEGACPADILELYEVHYHDLGWEMDDLDYIEPTCLKSQIIEFYDYNLIHQRQSNYQLLTFWERKSDGDICMNIENTLQICSSYRPHYHEFFVHYPARYMEKVERVIFIGGGDAMLLHEVLKFPTLEKVVGLELDQHVTRNSFDYFKSQPHWDDPRVEWWYGDATKTLTLLPQEYWGSFDLVLVDLSETVMSMSVTGELDIFSALALLLKPEGIMVKNEPYIDQFSNFFDHTIHIYYGTPMICTQVLVMGSNKVDFLHHPVAEHHGIERLLLEPLDDPSDRFKYMHDYRKNNATEQGKCNMEEGSVTQHGKKAGILEVVEAEYVSITLDKTFEAKIYSIVEEAGLIPISSPSEDDDPIIVVMKEGYVVARMWPAHKYCALDIHLWGAFEKLSALRLSLTDALGSKTVSAFRIVAGGMFGAHTFLADRENAIGIQVTQTRNCEAEVVKSGEDADDEKAMETALLRSVDLLEKLPNLKTVVLCGFEGKDSCSGFDVLSKDDRVKHIIPIWACEGLDEVYRDPSEYQKMYACEKKVEELLAASTGEDDEVDMLVIDESAPREMAQVLSSIFSYAQNREAFLSDNHVFVAMMKEGGTQPWRREFMEQYRKAKRDAPLFRTKVLMKTGDSSLALEALFCGSNSFQRFYDMESSLAKALPGYKVEVEKITGGLQFYDPEYNMKEFPDSVYDRRPATQQSKNQLALGRQSIFQFEYVEEDESEILGVVNLNSFFKATLDSLSYLPTNEATYTGVGDGVVIVSRFSEGSAVLVWDGKRHVDINLFSADQSEERANEFKEKFMQLSRLSSYLRDDQPRGLGRVMRFEYEEIFR
eukprot:scaffold3210_cov113-Cylindrotheca_fusiformis.AAC.3